MPDIMMHNETGYELAPWILEAIKADAIEYFGEDIASIRIQVGSYRHAFNVTTREVRYAFFPDEYELESPDASSDAAALTNMVSLSTPDRSVLATSDLFDADDEDEDDFGLLDEEFDELDHTPDGSLKDMAIGSDDLDDSDTVMIGDESDDLD